MSLSKRVYEGSDPNALLKEILAEHGSSVEISKPELVRKGGVLGFFATSHYRMEVHPNISQLRTEHVPVGAMAAAEASTFEGPNTGTRGALEALANETQDTFDLSTTNERSFESILEEVAGSLGEEPSRFSESPLMTQAKEYLSRTNSANAVSEGYRHFETPTFRMAPFHSGNQESLDDNDPWIFDSHDQMDHQLPIPVGVKAQQPTPLGGLQSAPTFDPPSIAHRQRVSDLVIDHLREVKFPARLLEGLVQAEVDLTFEMAFSLLPPAPKLPNLPGSLIAVVGPPETAKKHGLALAKSLRLAPDDIAYARQPKTPAKPADIERSRPKEAVLFDPEHAAVLAPGLRRDRIAIVVVELGDSKANDRWTKNMLRALRPTTAWAVIDARTKNIDIAHHAAAVGGYDALIIEQASRTCTPCEVLDSDIPVARLDNKVANAQSWTKAVKAIQSATRN